MSTINIAISVQDSLYEQVTSVAEEMKISQSELFALAMQEYLERRRKQKMIESFNDAYADGLDEAERTLLEAARLYQRTIMEQEE